MDEVMRILTFSLCILSAFTDEYLNKWAIQTEGGPNKAQEIAERHGFHLEGQIGSLDGYYLLTHHEVSKRSTEQAHHHHSRLQQEDQVLWVEQQRVKRRVKRDYTEPSGPPGLPASAAPFQDPLWGKQWYMHGGATGGYDMNIIPAWSKGYSGKGVVVTILDDGIEHNHPDLMDNYDSEASWDINADDPDPMPKYDDVDTNRHGTRCAGEVAATANNSRCVVGAAFNANIGGVRMLDGDVSDYVEARSLSLNPQHIDIYSASWGPDDNGKVVDGPAKLAMEAFIKGVLEGRGGKGSIFVWASGNGGSQHDSCNCDGYTNSIFTLSISSASERGTKPWYLEECSSTLATTYSSGKNYGERKIITTDLHGKCTESHTGTSASAPLAAGICALALESNPDLTWRDMQYIVMMTARPEPLVDGDWTTNGVGRQVSHRYGYGLMDAGALVNLAERWTTVPEQHICTTKVMQLDRKIDNSHLTVEVTTDGCPDTPNEVRYLEHVQAKISLQYSRRGDLEIYLVSPNGTRSSILQKRQNDKQERDFHDWPFMSVHFWGEQPMGTWKLELKNLGSSDNSGSLFTWQLILYGVNEDPVNLKPAKMVSSKHTIDVTSNAVLTDEHRDLPDIGSIELPEDMDLELGNANSWPRQWPWIYDSEVVLDAGCHSQCSEEAGCTGSRPQDCLVCRHVRLGQDGPCVDSCPDSTYADLSSGECRRCEPPCQTCEGPGLDQCDSCLTGSFYMGRQRTCLEQCPLGYMQDEESGTCRECSDNCLSCEDSTSYCTSCRSNHELVNHHCVLSCSSDEYQRHDGSCGLCDVSCETCRGPSNKECTSCQVGQLYQNGSCVRACSPGFYERQHPDRRTCESCHVSCRTCRGPGEIACDECWPGFSRTGQQCMPVCEEGSYQSVEGKCVRCHTNCLSCRGGTLLECTSCPQGRFLSNGACITDCPVGQYLQLHDGTSAVCSPCDTSCAACGGPGIGDCTLCKEGQLLHNGKCVHTCADSTFASHNACLACDPSCGSCSGPDATQCLHCNMGHVLMSGQCLVECPLGHYVADHICHACHNSCRTCAGSDANDCLSCQNSHVIQDGRCLPAVSATKCMEGTYWQAQEKLCKACESSCKSCRGPGPNNCLSCVSPRKYYVHQHRCVLCCADGEAKGCCNCHPDTGVCIEDRNIDYDFSETRDTKNGNTMVAQSLAQHGRSSRGKPSQIKPPFYSVLSVLVFFCVLSITVFLGVFGVLQARSHRRFCWGHKYEPIPMYRYLQNGNDKVSQMRLDSEEDADDEDFSSA